MLFGVISYHSRQFLYRIESLQTAKRDDQMRLAVTDLEGRQWTSGFTGKQILDSFDSDIVPTWKPVQGRIEKAVENNEFEIDTSTGVLHCPLEITKNVKVTVNLPPRKDLFDHEVSKGIHADVVFSLFEAWWKIAHPDCSSDAVHGRSQEKMEVEVSETPVKSKRSVGDVKTIDSYSKSQKKKQRRLSLRCSK